MLIASVFAAFDLRRRRKILFARSTGYREKLPDDVFPGCRSGTRYVFGRVRRSAVNLLSYGLHQLGEGDMQCLRYPVEHHDRDVLLATLDRAHVAAVEAALMGEPFLGKSPFPA